MRWKHFNGKGCLHWNFSQGGRAFRMSVHTLMRCAASANLASCTGAHATHSLINAADANHTITRATHNVRNSCYRTHTHPRQPLTRSTSCTSGTYTAHRQRYRRCYHQNAPTSRYTASYLCSVEDTCTLPLIAVVVDWDDNHLHSAGRMDPHADRQIRASGQCVTCARLYTTVLLARGLARWLRYLPSQKTRRHARQRYTILVGIRGHIPAWLCQSGKQATEQQKGK